MRVCACACVRVRAWGWGSPFDWRVVREAGQACSKQKKGAMQTVPTAVCCVGRETQAGWEGSGWAMSTDGAPASYSLLWAYCPAAAAS